MEYFSTGGSARRRYRRRAANRRFNQFKKIAIIWAGLFFLLAVFMVFGLRLEQTRVSAIEIIGAEDGFTTKITDVVGRQISGMYALVIPKNSILFYPKENIESSIKTHYPVFKTVSLKIENFKKLVVSVTKREPYALWCQDRDDITASSSVVLADCYLIDETGYIFDIAPQEKDNTFIIINGPLRESVSRNSQIGGRFPITHILALQNIRERFSLAGIEIEGFSVLSNGDYSLTTQSGVNILWTADTNARNLYETLYATLKTDNLKERLDNGLIEYIDLRFKNKVFYK